MEELIQELIDRQVKSGLGDRLFAERIGLSRSAWLKVRSHRGGLGPQALSGIVRAFPELRSYVAGLLEDEAREILGEEVKL